MVGKVASILVRRKMKIIRKKKSRDARDQKHVTEMKTASDEHIY